MSPPTPRADDPQRRAVARFVAGAIMAIGALIVALSGSCTLYFAVTYLAGFRLGANSYATSLFFITLLLMALFGGLPFVLAIGLFRAAAELYRSSSPQPAAADEPD